MHTREQQQRIGDLAFQLWEQRGFPHHSDSALRAEAESQLGFAIADQTQLTRAAQTSSVVPSK